MFSETFLGSLCCMGKKMLTFNFCIRMNMCIRLYNNLTIFILNNVEEENKNRNLQKEKYTLDIRNIYLVTLASGKCMHNF